MRKLVCCSALALLSFACGASDDEPNEGVSGASGNANSGRAGATSSSSGSSGRAGATSSSGGSSGRTGSGRAGENAGGAMSTGGRAGSDGSGEAGGNSESGASSGGATNDAGSSGRSSSEPSDPQGGPAAGNPDGDCAIPAAAGLANVSNPRSVVGDGTPESCTANRFIEAVAGGGVITFDCGPDPLTITLDRTAKIFNDTGPEIVIDGGGKITLSGGGKVRILYMNTCDEAQVWTSATCQNQDHPRLTVQNLTFVDGNSTGELQEGGGGGAILVRGGRFKVINSRFFGNVCDTTGPDLGGAALRVLSQHQGQPVYVVNSTFGGTSELGNSCSNGGGLSSIGVSWTILNSLFSHNRALGRGGNPADSGTPGGGSGGAIYNDGNTMTLSLCGTRIENNQVNAYGSAIFFVSNDHSGTLAVTDSVIRNNSGGGWNVLPGISMHEDTMRSITNSTIQ